MLLTFFDRCPEYQLALQIRNKVYFARLFAVAFGCFYTWIDEPKRWGRYYFGSVRFSTCVNTTVALGCGTKQRSPDCQEEVERSLCGGNTTDLTARTSCMGMFCRAKACLSTWTIWSVTLLCCRLCVVMFDRVFPVGTARKDLQLIRAKIRTNEHKDF